MEWLNRIGIKKNLGFTEAEDSNLEPLPAWGTFLIWLGFWMAYNQIRDGRIFCTILLPSRICCAALCSFGALLCSLRNPATEISWETFLDCEEEVPVYLLYRQGNMEKQVQGILKDVIYNKNQALRRIQITSGGKLLKGLNHTVSKTAFNDYKISLNPHYRAGLLKNLPRYSLFLKNILKNMNESRLLSTSPESIIIANKAGFHRDIRHLYLGYQSSQNRELLKMEELILAKHHRTLIMSPRAKDIEKVTPPLAILDGLDSFKSRDYVSSPNVLILFDKTEYQEEADGIVHSFSNICDRVMPQKIQQLPEITLSEIQVNFYVFT